ncbi:response regulator [Alteromonas facilis]|uniref:response regulator n=1 Tax=Alteromonas facilis TaxID=2048004 RepID=UPI000C28A631|nr:response regulator [Alteromonas facilis]
MSKRNLNILAVDDDRVTLELLTLMLDEYTSGQIVAFENSREALLDLTEGETKFDLVISDLMMPDVTGLELLGAFRLRDVQTPFIMLTANATRESVLEARNLGATAFIAKPFTAHDLLDKLDSIFTE